MVSAGILPSRALLLPFGLCNTWGHALLVSSCPNLSKGGIVWVCLLVLPFNVSSRHAIFFLTPLCGTFYNCWHKLFRKFFRLPCSDRALKTLNGQQRHIHATMKASSCLSYGKGRLILPCIVRLVLNLSAFTAQHALLRSDLNFVVIR